MGSATGRLNLREDHADASEACPSPPRSYPIGRPFFRGDGAGVQGEKVVGPYPVKLIAAAVRGGDPRV